MKSNRINFEIPASLLKEVNEAIDSVSAKLTPYLLTDITKGDLEGYARMGEMGLTFVNTAIECASTNESLVPRYHNLADAKTDMKYFESLRELNNKIGQLTGLVTMNRELAGVELLDFSNDVYSTVKRLYQAGDPAGISAFPLLKSHYAKPRRKGKDAS
jgi:hypothetical protein